MPADKNQSAHQHSLISLHCQYQEILNPWLFKLLQVNPILLYTTTPTFANSVDPDQMASEEAI